MKKIKKIQKRESGFTLIELLVVIGIIAVLATIGTISFGNAASRSRDAKRQSDLRTLVSGLQIYNTRQGQFPPVVAGTLNDTTSTWTQLQDLLGTSGVMPPRPNSEYCYYRDDTNRTAIVLIATDFEGQIPSDAITGTGTVALPNQIFGAGNSFTYKTSSDDVDVNTDDVCDNNGTAIGAAATQADDFADCDTAGTDPADGEYCIRATTGALF